MTIQSRARPCGRAVSWVLIGASVMGRPPQVPVEKTGIVLNIVAGEMSIAEAARREKAFEQSNRPVETRVPRRARTVVSARQAKAPRDRPPKGPVAAAAQDTTPGSSADRRRTLDPKPVRSCDPDDRHQQRWPVPVVRLRGIHRHPPRDPARPTFSQSTQMPNAADAEAKEVPRRPARRVR
jgi:transposase